MSANQVGELKEIPLSLLRPDWKNPRFPPAAVEKFSDDLDVYAYLDERFDAASVAESISRHGFFQSEPLIAIPTSDHDFVVLEGNRRLTALKSLANPAIMARMVDARWKTISAESGQPISEDTLIPVLVAPSRESVAPILGYRHVTGITPWDPFQQARYVSSLIDDVDSDLNAADVARLIGRNVSEVKSFYRNYSIVEQARDIFQIPDVDRIVDEFGVWTRAMTSSGIRDYLLAPAPKDVQEGTYPLPEGSRDHLENAITWLFGEPRSDEEREEGKQSSKGRVISDSRELTRLGSALSTAEGRAALEADETLKDAERAALNGAARFVEALSSVRSGLIAARKSATLELIVQHAELLDEIDSTISDIRAVR